MARIKMTDDEIEARVGEGFEANSRGDHKLSISILESTRKIIESDSSHSNALRAQYCILLNYLSSAYRKIGERTNALENALLGVAEFEKLPPEVFEDLQYMYADNCNNAANVLADAERLDEALHFLDKAIDCKGPKLLFVNNRAQICLAFDDIDRAIESLSLVFSLNIEDRKFGSKDAYDLYSHFFNIVQTAYCILDRAFVEGFLSRLEAEIEASSDFLHVDYISSLLSEIANIHFFNGSNERAIKTATKGLNYFGAEDVSDDDVPLVYATLKINRAIYLGAIGNSQEALEQVDECLQRWEKASLEASFDEFFQTAEAIRFLEIGKIEKIRGNYPEAARAFMDAWASFPQRQNQVQITYAKAVSRVNLGELLLKNSQNKEAKESFIVADMLLTRLVRDNRIDFDLELIRSAIGLARCEVRQFQDSKAEEYLLNAAEIAARHAQDPRFQDVREQLATHQRALKAQKDSMNTQGGVSSKHPWGERSVSRVQKTKIDTSELSGSIGFESFTISQKQVNFGLAIFTIISILLALILPNLLYKLGVFVLSMLFWVTFSTFFFLYSTSPWSKISKLSFNLNEVVTLRPTPFLNTRVERTGQQNELEEALNKMASWYSPFVVGLAMLFFGWILGNLLVFFPGPGFETPYSAAFFFAIQAWGPLGLLIVRLRVFSKHSSGKLVLRPRYDYVIRRIFGLVGRFDEDALDLINLHATGIDALFTRPFAKPGLGRKYRRFRFPWLTISRFCLSTAVMILSYPILLISIIVWMAWPEI